MKIVRFSLGKKTGYGVLDDKTIKIIRGIILTTSNIPVSPVN